MRHQFTIEGDGAFAQAHKLAALEGGSLQFAFAVRQSAKLDHGDCTAYALAKQTGKPLLYEGDDFLRTGIQPTLH